MQFILVNPQSSVQKKISLATSCLFHQLGYFHNEVETLPGPLQSLQIACYPCSVEVAGICFKGDFETQLAVIENGLIEMKPVEVRFSMERSGDTLLLDTNLLAWIYTVISHREEQLINDEARDKHQRVPFENSLAKRQGWTSSPQLSELIQKVDDAVRRYCIAMGKPLLRKKPWPGDHIKAAIISHDVDILDKWILYAGKLFLENLVKAQWKAGYRVTISTFSNLFERRNPVTDIRWILETEKQYGFRSSWHFLCGKADLVSLLKSDITYSQKEIQKLLPLLQEYQAEVALHSSFKTPDNPDLFRQQTAILNGLYPGKIKGVRAHFLRYNSFAYFQAAVEQGLTWDSSNGFAEMAGFRTGFTGAYQPVINDERTGLWEFPLHWMDRSFSKYRNLTPDEILAEFEDLVSHFNRFGGVLTLLWHNFSISDLGFLGYESLYGNMLEALAKNKFYNDTPQNLVFWLDKKESTTLAHEADQWLVRSGEKKVALRIPENGTEIWVDCENLSVESV